ncbi:unnamed protein product [Phytophthora fragariaefolia]|uniref:Unnamed protein product n=1 Tax=Phytophthora fragariaefolia TaxID=1490495 RepID=A0A9W6UCH3_9STRA|nr:unnamed protein product [Phytophthora fragariaefolia]
MGRLPGWDPLRAECSRYYIYAFLHKPAVDPGSKQRDLHGNAFDLYGKRIPMFSSVCPADDYSRSSDTVMMDLDPECRRGYWKQQDPDLWFKPAVGEMLFKIPGSSRVEAYVAKRQIRNLRKSGDPE